MIFHIFGGETSGKTSVAKQLDPDMYAHWCIVEDFYKPEGIINKDNKMDWDLWKAKEKKIKTSIQEFIENNTDKHVIIETSGINRNANTVLKQYGAVPIYMGVPTPQETIARCKKCNVDVEVGYDINKLAIVKFWDISDYLPPKLTIEEAVKTIKGTKQQE